MPLDLMQTSYDFTYFMDLKKSASQKQKAQQRLPMAAKKEPEDSRKGGYPLTSTW